MVGFLGRGLDQGSTGQQSQERFVPFEAGTCEARSEPGDPMQNGMQPISTTQAAISTGDYKAVGQKWVPIVEPW